MRRLALPAKYGWVICAAALALAVFVRCFRLGYTPNVGLDPSWGLGIVEGAATHLVFGRDIVFTFGPLGYLIEANTLASRAWQPTAFQAMLAVLLAVLSAWHFLVARSALQKLGFAALILILATLCAADEELLILAFLLIWTLPPFRRESVTPGWALALGAFAGFASLTKFTVGIDAFAGCVALLALKLYVTRRVPAARITNARSFVIFALAFAALALPIAASASFGPFAAAALSAVALASAIWFAASPNVATRRAALFGGLCVLVLCLAPSARAYATTSLQISSGYSAAMSYAGPPWQLSIALALACVSILLLVAGSGDLTAPVALALSSGLFLGFKHGFVRQDAGHVMVFFTYPVAIAAIAIAVSRDRRFLTAAFLAAAIALFGAQAARRSIGYPSFEILSQLSPDSVLKDASRAFSPQPGADEIRSNFATGLQGDRLSSADTAKLASGTVEVLPWESNVVFANGLRWKPEPIFQSYSAYTPALDELNAADVAQHGADHILFAWQSVDGRYPLWDEPAAFREIACGYRLDRSFAQPSQSANGQAYLVLAKSGARCAARSSSDRTIETGWDSPITIPSEHGRLTFAAIEMHYSVLGRAFDLLYRVPPIEVKVASTSGQTDYYRIAGEVAIDGILVNPLPRDLGEFGALLQGAAPGNSSTITLETEAPWLFADRLRVTFQTIAYR